MVKKSKGLPVEKLGASKATKAKPVPVKIVSDTASYPKEDQKWRAADDLSTLQRAREIENDKAERALLKTNTGVAKNIRDAIKQFRDQGMDMLVEHIHDTIGPIEVAVLTYHPPPDMKWDIRWRPAK